MQSTSFGQHQQKDRPCIDPKLQETSHQTSPVYGTITVLKKAFGFVRPAGSSLDLFFHFNQLQPDVNPASLAVGQGVQFLSGTDINTGRSCATCVCPVPESVQVQHFVVQEDDLLGYVIQWPVEAHLSAHSTPGILRYIDSHGKVGHLTFGPQDVAKAPNQADASASTWARFNLSFKQGMDPDEVSKPQSAKRGFKAVSVRAMESSNFSLDHVQQQHYKLLDTLAAVHPR